MEVRRLEIGEQRAERSERIVNRRGMVSDLVVVLNRNDAVGCCLKVVGQGAESDETPSSAIPPRRLRFGPERTAGSGQPALPGGFGPCPRVGRAVPSALLWVVGECGRKTDSTLKGKPVSLVWFEWEPQNGGLGQPALPVSTDLFRRRGCIKNSETGVSPVCFPCTFE